MVYIWEFNTGFSGSHRCWESIRTKIDPTANIREEINGIERKKGNYNW